MQSITTFTPRVNTSSKLSNTVVSTAEDHYILYGKYGDVHNKHRIMKDYLKDKAITLKRSVLTFLEELINNSNWEGVSRIGQKKLASLLTCSVRTILSYYKMLESLDILSFKKNGWQQTNTTVLLPIHSKLNNKVENFSTDLNTSYIQDHKYINHYDGNVCVFADLEESYPVKLEDSNCKEILTSSNLSNSTPLTLSNSRPLNEPEKPDSSEIPNSSKPERIMKSEYEVQRETLPESLTEAVYKHIPSQHRELATTTLKRLIASHETKLELIKLVGCKANQFNVNNIAGLLVSESKKMTNKTQEAPPKPRDWNRENEIRSKAHEMATAKLKELGVIDPRESNKPDWDALSEYDTKHSCWYIRFLRELDPPKVFKSPPQNPPKFAAKRSNSEIPKDWVQDAY